MGSIVMTALFAACLYGLWVYYQPRRDRWGIPEKALFWAVGVGASAVVSFAAAGLVVDLINGIFGCYT